MVETVEARAETYGAPSPTQLGTEAKAHLLEGRWRLLKRRGQGSVGAVWLAHDVDLDRPVAVKRLHDALASDPAAITGFEAHAKRWAMLEHPSLVPVLGMGKDGAVPFVVLKLVEGRSLAELLHQRGGQLPAAEVSTLMLQLAEALDALHVQGVLHRDLKPSNLLVDDTGRLTVLDVGLARSVGTGRTKTGHLPGTEPYLSPEELRGEGVDARADVYSLGVLAFELLAGQPPREGVTLPATVPAELAALITQCLATTPDARPVGAAEVAHALRPFAGAAGAVASPAPVELPTAPREHDTAPTDALPAPTVRTSGPKPQPGDVPRAKAPEVTRLTPNPLSQSPWPEGQRTTRPAPAVLGDDDEPAQPTEAIPMLRPVSVLVAPPPIQPASREAESGPVPQSPVQPTRITPNPLLSPDPREITTKPTRRDGMPMWLQLGALAVFALIMLTVGPELAASDGEIPLPPPPPPPAQVSVPTAPLAPPPKLEEAPPPPAVTPVVELASREERATPPEPLVLAPRGKKPSTAPVKAGLLVVTTTMEGWEVPSILWVDGVRYPGTTPHVVGPLSHRIHELRIQHGNLPVEVVRYPVTPKTLKKQGARLIIELSPTPESSPLSASPWARLDVGKLTDGRDREHDGSIDLPPRRQR